MPETWLLGVYAKRGRIVHAVSGNTRVSGGNGMTNIIYDERTPHSRLMVGYDRYGISIREWSDEVPEGETGFSVQDGFFTWRAWRERERC